MTEFGVSAIERLISAQQSAAEELKRIADFFETHTITHIPTDPRSVGLTERIVRWLEVFIESCPEHNDIHEAEEILMLLKADGQP